MKTTITFLSLVLALCHVRAEITSTAFVVTAPNLSLSADAPDYKSNLFYALQTGAKQVGSVGLPSTFTLAGTMEASLSPVTIISTPCYHSWGPEVNPSNAPYSSQYGGSMVVGAHVFGNGVRFLPQQIIFDRVSNQPFGLFNGRETYSGFSTFNSNILGATYNPDGTKTWHTNGSLVPVNELIFFEWIAIESGATGTPEQIHAQTISALDDPFNILAQMGIRGVIPSDGNAPFEVFAPTDISVSPIPVLEITLSPSRTNVVVSWTVAPFPCSLEAASDLNQSFAPLALPITTNGFILSGTVPVSGFSKRFFRLSNIP